MDWKLVGQWVAIAIVLIGTLLHFEHRLTSVETAVNEQMKGYQVMFSALSDKLTEFNRRIERLEERSAR